LINDILDLSKVEAGKLQLDPADVVVADFVKSLSIVVEPMTSAKSLAYRVEIEPSLPSVWVDATRLRQVLLNLLSNAVKFTDGGSVTLRAYSAPRSGGVILEVEDTGIGISEEHLEGIFEEFRQVDQSITRQHGGTGLGLAISRKLVDLMGGALRVESTLGEGSRFHVELRVGDRESQVEQTHRRVGTAAS
jgi:signal transduction histidine kinase